MTHKEFVELYKDRKIEIGVGKGNAERLVISHPKANKYNVPATRFWMYLSFLLIFILPIPLWMYKGFIFGLGVFLFGLLVHSSNKKSAQRFIYQDMLENKDFFESIMGGELPLDDIQRPVIITKINK